MRLVTLFIFLSSMLYARDSYELQLFATRYNDFQGLQRVLKLGKSAGLGCYVTKESRDNGTYTFVRCDKTTSFQKISQSIKKAKKAGLTYYLLKPDHNRQSAFDKVEKTKTYMLLPDISYSFFGENEELIRILHNKNEISKEDIQKRKEIFLKDIKNRERFNGLYLKGDSSRNLTKDKIDYDIRLEWDIFDNGYIGSQKDIKKRLIQKELEYDQIMDEYKSANLKLSLYKMEAVSNNIEYNFLKQQESILAKMLRYSRKKYDASLITANELFKYKKAYDNIKHNLSYYDYLYKEPYDVRLKPLVSNIENIKLVDMSALIKEAYLNNYKLNSSKKRVELSTMRSGWSDRLKTNLYVENKKHYFLDDSDTIAGVQVQIPLDFKSTKDRSVDIEIEANRLKEQMLKKLIDQNIKDIYHKIKYHKTYINTLKSNIDFFRHEMSSMKLKLKYPLSKQLKDPKLEIDKINLSVSKEYQKIWQERTEVLKLLLELQHLCGVQILA